MGEKERLGAMIAGYQRMYGILDEEMAVIMRMSRQTFMKRKKQPETYRVEELLLAAKKFKVTLTELLNGKGKQ
jgi:hypothetical protein